MSLDLLPVGDAFVSSLPPETDECEACFARWAVATFNLGGVETPLCAGCSTYRTADGAEVVIYNGGDA